MVRAGSSSSSGGAGGGGGGGGGAGGGRRGRSKYRSRRRVSGSSLAERLSCHSGEKMSPSIKKLDCFSPMLCHCKVACTNSTISLMFGCKVGGGAASQVRLIHRTGQSVRVCPALHQGVAKSGSQNARYCCQLELPRHMQST